MEVAKTILQQLGGNKFAVMTGAKNFVSSEDMLSFRLPSRFAKEGINAVRVKLEQSDTYTMTFLRIRGTSVKEIEVREMVYCDTLQSTFKAVTGLDTHL